MMLRMVLFGLMMTAVSGLLHYWLGLRLQSLLGLGERGSQLLWFAVWSFLALHVGAFMARPWVGEGPGDVLQWVGYICMGLFTLVLFWVVMAQLLDWLVFSKLELDPERRALLRQGLGWGSLGLAGLMSSAGLYQARQDPELEEVDIPVPALPEALEGFRIAQLSDIHIGGTIKGPFLRRIVDQVNALRPDMVAITGDLVDGSVESLREDAEELRGLQSAEGTFFVTGNHEYYSGAESWIRHLRSLGITVLMNEHVRLERGESSILLAGICDERAHTILPSHRSDPEKALEGAVPSDVSVLLAHQPICARRVAKLERFDLQLSGHTHGGQYFPGTLLVKLFQPFDTGLTRLGRLWLYVNRGTCYWGPPLRLGATQEITLLRLTRAPELSS